jgi:hypothetical protein
VCGVVPKILNWSFNHVCTFKQRGVDRVKKLGSLRHQNEEFFGKSAKVISVTQFWSLGWILMALWVVASKVSLLA